MFKGKNLHSSSVDCYFQAGNLYLLSLPYDQTINIIMRATYLEGLPHRRHHRRRLCTGWGRQSQTPPRCHRGLHLQG